VRGCLLGEAVGQPVETLVETVSGGGASGLDEPLSLERVQAQLVCELGDRHGVRQILLVGEHEQSSVSELVLRKHLLELGASLLDTLPIVRVDHEDQTLGVLEVVAPQRSDLILTTDIPHSEVDVLVLNSLDVETDGRDRRNDLTELELVQNRGLSGGIKTDHQNTHVLAAQKSLQQRADSETHRKILERTLFNKRTSFAISKAGR